MALCLHGEMQIRLRKEIRTHISHNNPPSYAEMKKLQYMNNFIKETLRRYCPGKSPIRTFYHTPPSMIDKVSLVIFYARSPLTPLRIPSAPDVLVPAGTILVQCPATFQFNSTIWEPDAHIFNSDRHD